ncbi:hypothetical protein GHK48_23495 [Sinorhizobium fredii]|uniref:Uncharacterized protein n=1 Tax=Rhizobium fredii TaxID=380 RepID=A0A844AD90_RHIFR|nr:hypothetical protein [Sinorhizobium fredii]GEC30146.1 hypothetical protein EFR01_03170 [Sinorhizobium fredii]GLS10059.1 hypothetical protein GCM10007864_36900 [Sinorhizobium fredii]
MANSMIVTPCITALRWTAAVCAIPFTVIPNSMLEFGPEPNLFHRGFNAGPSTIVKEANEPHLAVFMTLRSAPPESECR